MDVYEESIASEHSELCPSESTHHFRLIDLFRLWPALGLIGPPAHPTHRGGPEAPSGNGPKIKFWSQTSGLQVDRLVSSGKREVASEH